MQASALQVGLHHHHALRHSGLRLVALDELLRDRVATNRILRYESPALVKDVLRQPAMFGWCNGLKAMRQDSYRMTTGIDCGTVRNRVTAQGQTANDTPPLLNKK